MTKFSIRVGLLEVLQKFAMDADAPNQALACIRFSPESMIATNGQRFVSVPLVATCKHKAKCKVEPHAKGEIDEPFLLPRELVEMLVTAVRGLWPKVEEDDEGEYVPDFRQAMCEVSLTADTAFIEYDQVTLSAPLRCKVKNYPNTDALEATLHREGTPWVSCFNPGQLADVEQLLLMTDDQPGILLHAWDVLGTGSGPTEWRSVHDTRLIVMGMAPTNEDAKYFQRLYERAKNGSAVSS